MHALRKYIESEMDERGWKPADLVSASGVSKQVISGLLNDSRGRIDRMPLDKTIDGLARAFSAPRTVVLLRVAEAMGLPVEPVEVHDPRCVPDDKLIQELARRLAEGGGGHADGSAPNTQAAGKGARLKTHSRTPRRRQTSTSRTPLDEPVAEGPV